VRDTSRTVIQAFRIQEEPLPHETSIEGFRTSRSHHPGAGCAIARPSSAEEGNQNVQICSIPATSKAGIQTVLREAPVVIAKATRIPARAALGRNDESGQ
jgi:hypothetical protein